MTSSHWFLAFTVLLASMARASLPADLEPVSPGKLFKGGYINVRAPNSEGWRLARSSPNGMEFGKPARAPGETLSAQLLMFGLERTETPEQFVALIKRGIEKDTNTSRFNVIR